MIVVFLTAPPGLYPGAGNEIFRAEAATMGKRTA
jgi:hypothetical protein